MAERLEIIVKLTNQKVQFTGSARSNPSVIFDYKAPVGDGQGYTGLEMLLMSLAACSGTAVAFLLRKKKKRFSGLQVKAHGTRRDEPPTSLKNITLEFVLSSKDTTSSELEQVIRLAEASACPVWAMLKNNVEIQTSHKVVESLINEVPKIA